MAKTKAKNKTAKKVVVSGNLLMAVLYIVIGVCLCFGGPGEAIKVPAYIIGALFIIEGLLDMFLAGNFIGGVVSIIIGAVIIILAAVLAGYLLLILGILLALYGVYHIIVGTKTTLAIIINALILIAGVLLIIGNSVATGIVQAICIVAGVVMIIEGVLALFGKKLM